MIGWLKPAETDMRSLRWAGIFERTGAQVVVRAETAADVQGIRWVVAAAFADQRVVADLAEALRAAPPPPKPAIFIEEPPGYHFRFGFDPAASLGTRRPSWRIPEPAFQVKRLLAYTPELSGTRVYPEAFWALDCVGLRGGR